LILISFPLSTLNQEASHRSLIVKKIGILNKDISEVIAGMGHRDRLVVCDAGLPIPSTVRRIDLAIREGLPGFTETVEALLVELEIEGAIMAEELEAVSPHIYDALMDAFDGLDVEAVPHESFKELTREAVAIVRTGEFTPYANVILVAGVVF
jgi:D-ribose pyranase